MIELLGVLILPVAGAAVLAALGHRARAPEINVATSGLTFLSAAALTARVMSQGPLLALDRLFFVDSFNVFLVALTALVGLTTALFSRPYMRIEQAHGRLSAGRLRLYHSMFQLFMATMLTALLTNNMGILWVAMEAATLTTVLLVSLYRTPASLEAAWKYFILCGVGIAQALFGTILLYFAAEKVLGAGAARCCGPSSSPSRRSSSPRCCRWRSCSCWSATAPRSASRRCTTGCPTRTRRVRRRSPRCSPGCC